MSDGLRAEDVKEALGRAIPGVDEDGYTQPHYPSLEIVFAAARAYLASQEQTPDYQAAADQLNAELAEYNLEHHGTAPGLVFYAAGVKEIVDAALVGFHPQPTKSPEVPT